MAVLVTGGAGYIGSHTCVELLEAGHEIVVVDNLHNSSIAALERVRDITGRDFAFHRLDLTDRAGLERIFAQSGIEAVIHFAGLKAVAESVAMPLSYYYNNIVGTVILCDVMQQFDVRRLVFSSSATVYGVPKQVPVTEDAPLHAINPYGRTKLMIEEILRDLYESDRRWSIALLRYFNPIGAHSSGRIGEDPSGIPNNLMPYLTQVAAGRRDKLHVFGGDYPTRDGTGVRDYVHVVDLARGHLSALGKVTASTGIDAYNLGTGTGYSVLEVISAFERATGVTIPYRIVDRRPGDAAIVYADPSKARRELGWEAVYGLEQMCEDAWRWQRSHPDGYGTEHSLAVRGIGGMA